VANELATAYIQLLPSFRGLRREVERGLKDVEPAAKAAGEKAGRALQDELVGDSAAGKTAAEFARQGERAGDAFVDAATDEVGGGRFDRVGELAGEDIGDGVRDALDGAPVVDPDQLVADRSEFTRAGERAGDSLGDGVRSSLDGVRLFDADNLAAGRDFQQAGQRIGEDTADGVSSGLGGIAESFSDVLGSLPAPAAAAAAAIGATLVAGIGTALERGRLESKFEVTLGASEGTARALGQRAGEIYADNFGQSLEEVGDAVARVQRTFGDELDDDALDEVTEKALTLANFFEEDLNSVVRASSKLISTGLADDAEEAFDIITTGLQGTANEGQDFLDTINEYSVQFEKLGLDGADALNLISQGLENGARDSELVADAFKEFSIRAVEGSAEVEQAFATLNIDDGAARIAAGGETARTALGEVLDALRDIEDPALRAQVAFRLFGGQSEDLGGALLALDLDETVADIGKIPGASDKAVDGIDDLSSNFETLKRTIGTGVGALFEDLLEFPASLASGDSFAEQGEAAARSFWTAFQLFVGPGSGLLDKTIDTLTNRLGVDVEIGILNAVLNPGEEVEAPDFLIDRLNGVEASAEGASGELTEYEEAARRAGVSSEVASDGADAIAAALERTAINGDLAAAGIEAAAAGAAAYLEAVENATTADDLALAAVGSGSAIREILEGAAAEGVEALRLPPLFDAVTAALGGYSESQEGALSALIDAGEASQGVIAGLLESGNVQGALDAADQIRDKFTNEILPALGITDEAAQQYYLTLLGLDETTVDTAIELSGAEQALQTLGLYSEILQNLGTFSLEDQFKVADLINQGDIEGARALIDAEIEEGRDAVTLKVEADVQPATTTVENWVTVEGDRPPTPVQIGADVSSGVAGVANWVTLEGNRPPVPIKIGADDDLAQSIVDTFRAGVLNAPALIIDVGLQAIGVLADILGENGELTVDILRAILPGFSTGGLVEGPGTATSDSIVARLSAGEYVMDAATVRAYGVDFFESLQRRELPGFANGGAIEGPGTATSDSIVARLSAGEYVMDAATVEVYGPDFFAALQRRDLPGFANGGPVGSVPAPAPAPGGSGVAIDYTVVEAKSRPRPEDLVRVTSSAMFLGAV
jgi:hypothetical protein